MCISRQVPTCTIISLHISFKLFHVGNVYQAFSIAYICTCVIYRKHFWTWCTFNLRQPTFEENLLENRPIKQPGINFNTTAFTTTTVTMKYARVLYKVEENILFQECCRLCTCCVVRFCSPGVVISGRRISSLNFATNKYIFVKNLRHHDSMPLTATGMFWKKY
jgi:hypothetical protein